MIYINDKETGKIHKVWKYLLSGDGQENVWCHDWYGHHIIGSDCEFIDHSSTQKNEFVIPDVSVSLHEEKPIGSCMKDGCYKPQRNCGLCEEHYKEFGENLRQ